MPQRILVIGNSCAGKTTLAQQLAQKYQKHWVDLDELHWLPNWVERPDEEFVALIHSEILSQDEWIVSGNYTKITKNNLWPVADTVIWLNYPLRTILYRFFTRSYRRIVLKETCCNGNTENLCNTFIAKDNLFHWILATHHSKIRKFRAWKNGPHSDKHWVEISKPSQLSKMMDRLFV